MKLLSCLLFTTIFTITTTPLVSTVQRFFKLKSQVLTPLNPSFESLYLKTYHVYHAFNYAVLGPKTVANPGIIGHLNGTTDDFTYDNTDLIFGLGGIYPFGFVIDQVNATYYPIEINAEGGTKGIVIDQGVIKYHNPISGGFYACNNTLTYEPAVQLFYKLKFFTTPVNCSDVELVVEYV